MRRRGEEEKKSLEKVKKSLENLSLRPAGRSWNKLFYKKYSFLFLLPSFLVIIPGMECRTFDNIHKSSSLGLV
jgi:hypothetical protein